jgi:hypothetical protein
VKLTAHFRQVPISRQREPTRPPCHTSWRRVYCSTVKGRDIRPEHCKYSLHAVHVTHEDLNICVTPAELECNNAATRGVCTRSTYRSVSSAGKTRFPANTEVFTAVTMKNVVFWDIKIQFVFHRRHITSLLHRPAG